MYKILVIDDDPNVRANIKSALMQSDLKIELHEAEDGQLGYDAAQKLEHVDFFIIDYNMPKLNGLQVVEKLLQIERFATKPIMLYTTETNPTLVMKARTMSKTIRWVIKPLNKEPFIQAVKGCLGLNVEHIYNA